ncbi:MAG: hypothetical protein JW963_03315 [Anaerolineales bacterium]|nr:hypothetical protein [Anaerolineales bacterium]
MRVSFTIGGLPPKKDGANSIWRKGVEMPRLKTLRKSASQARRGKPLAQAGVHLTLRLYAEPSDGDLDNFVAGICDGLMTAYPRTPINDDDCKDLPLKARPRCPIAYEDDSCVAKIVAGRFPPRLEGLRYEAKIELL